MHTVNTIDHMILVLIPNSCELPLFFSFQEGTNFLKPIPLEQCLPGLHVYTLHVDANYLAITTIENHHLRFSATELKDLLKISNEIAWKWFGISIHTICPNRTVAMAFGGKLSVALKHNPPVWKRENYFFIIIFQHNFYFFFWTSLK